ncbi:tyrosine-type recombinase/integrase [Apilactobacillus xinyiensis]|uniref:tyrosine-type recombinase/integrase n=1 Tax=Apilactobacillus xinyiensis TaxID=2841032 RepID=UPI003364E21E
MKEHIKSVTLVNPSFDENPKDNLIISFLDKTPLNIKDILKITKNSVLKDNNDIKDYLHVRNSNTKQYEDISITDLKDVIKSYIKWLKDRGVRSKWLFPDEQDKHIDEDNFYLVMQRVGDLIGINYLGTHTMRKTGAYRVYVQSHYNISLVMSLLNHSSQAMTLKYLGLDRESTEKMLDDINFG